MPSGQLAERKLMRIGIVGPTWPDSMAENIIDALRGMGHQPVSVGSSYALGNPYTSAVGTLVRNSLPAADQRLQQRIVRRALRTGCEAVIVTEQRLMPGIVRQLRSNGAKVALWFPDSLLNMGRQLMLISDYDVVFLKDPYVVRRLRSVLDVPVHYLPEACNPRWHRPLVTPGSEPYLVLAGNMYPSRIRLLERLVSHGIPIRLYGGRFPRWVGNTPLREFHAGRCVFLEEKAKIYRSAAGVLNNLHPAEVEGVNARLFEAAGCGAAVLTEFRPALPDLFDVGSEVLAFQDFAELLDQARRLLSEPGLSAKIGDAAAARAHQSHGYENRLAVILDKLG
jgi:spore maturation protein CgeB